MLLSSQNLKSYAQELGFSIVGIIPAGPSPTLAAYYRWLQAGYHAGMGYLARLDRTARRDDLNVILLFQQTAQSLQDNYMIVRQYDSDLLRHWLAP